MRTKVEFSIPLVETRFENGNYMSVEALSEYWIGMKNKETIYMGKKIKVLDIDIDPGFINVQCEY